MMLRVLRQVCDLCKTIVTFCMSGKRAGKAADKVAVDPADGKTRRYHVYDQDMQKAVRRAAR